MVSDQEILIGVYWLVYFQQDSEGTGGNRNIYQKDYQEELRLL